MHVAYIHQHFSTREGTTGTRSYEMSRRLLARGHRVTMICGAFDASDMGRTSAAPETGAAASANTAGTEPGRYVIEQNIEGIRVLRVAEPYSNKMGFLRRGVAFGRFARTAGKIVKGLDADLVFATSTPLTVGIPGTKGARHLGVPFVFEVRDLWPEIPIAVGKVRNPVLKWYLRRLERRIYFAAERIIALSPGMQEGIVRTGYPAERVTMIPNSCDLDLFRPDRGELNDPRFGEPGDLRLIYSGAIGLANGIDAVLDVAAELKRRNERGIRLIVVGKGAMREGLIERTRREGLEEIVLWPEAIPKAELAGILPRMGAGMMLFKNLSVFYYGTSPNKFFDYIASGLPIVNNYPGWVADMINERKCGIVVPPDNSAAFADAAVWLRDHRDEARAMGDRARQLAEERFSRDRLAEEFVSVLEQARTQWRGRRG